MQLFHRYQNLVCRWVQVIVQGNYSKAHTISALVLLEFIWPTKLFPKNHTSQVKQFLSAYVWPCVRQEFNSYRIFSPKDRKFSKTSSVSDFNSNRQVLIFRHCCFFFDMFQLLFKYIVTMVRPTIHPRAQPKKMELRASISFVRMKRMMKLSVSCTWLKRLSHLHIYSKGTIWMNLSRAFTEVRIL